MFKSSKCVFFLFRLLASWTTPVMPFTWNMWYAVLLTFLITCVGLVIAKRGSFDGIFITVFGVMIAQVSYCITITKNINNKLIGKSLDTNQTALIIWCTHY